MRRALAGALVIAAALGSSWAGTQAVAAQAPRAPWLGEPLASVAGARLYAPWAWLIWERRAAGASPETFRIASGLTGLGSLGGVLGLPTEKERTIMKRERKERSDDRVSSVDTQNRPRMIT